MNTFFTNKIKKFLIAILLSTLIFFNLYALPQKDFSFKNCAYKKVAILINSPKEETLAANILFKYLKKAFPNIEFFITQNPKDAFKYKSISISRFSPAPTLSFYNQENVRKTEISLYNGRIKIKYSSNPINAIGDFMRELGFEFFAPNEEFGTKLPNENSKIKRGSRTYLPPFISTSIYPLVSENKIFAQLNGNDPIFKNFSHNLSNIFTAEVLKEYPEFKPTLKKYASKKYLQPKFNSEKASDFTAQKAIEYFSKNKSFAFSIGINDSLNFDLSIPFDVDAKNRYISNFDSISNSYYTFANNVAKKINSTNPDKFIGLISYLPTLRHPDFPLEKNIVPYLCIDSSNFFNKNYKIEYFDILNEYANDELKLRGIYSYIYGSPFFVPRPTEEFEIELIRYAQKLNFNCYFAELNPIWAYDSFKCWAILKVLNGSPKTYNELKLEYFFGYYGGAGDNVIKFFEVAKSAWKNRTDTPKWLGFFLRDTVAELFTNDILNKMELHLINAENDAKLDENKKKIADLRLEFEKTKAFVKNYFTKKELFFLKFNDAKTSEIIDALKKSQDAKTEFENIAKKNSYIYKNSPRNINNFFPPTDELLKMALKKASQNEIEEIKRLINAQTFNTINETLIKKSKPIFTFNPETFKTEKDLENAISKNFIIKYLPSNSPEFKIDDCQNIYSLKVSNAFHYEFFKNLKLTPNKVFEIEFDINYQREISSELFLAVSVFNTKNKCVKYKEISIPPLKERRSDTFKFILKTPPNSTHITFGIYARQITKPIFIKKIEVKEFSD